MEQTLSANFCESLLLLRPLGDRSHLTIAATWSRALLPAAREFGRKIQLGQEVFEVAEALAPRLRSQPQPRLSRFVAWIDALRGQPSSANPHPSGEVDFTLFDEEQGELHARGILNANDYAIALAAHAVSNPVAFRAILRRLPRVSRLDSIADFEQLTFEDTPSEGSPTSEQSKDIPF